MALTSHRDLLVWQKSMQLCACAYSLAHELPPDEKFDLGKQIRRSAVSIPANIAEGKGRVSRAEYGRFLAIARGSARELDTLLGVTSLCHMIPESSVTAPRLLADEVVMMLTAMLRKLLAK